MSDADHGLAHLDSNWENVKSEDVCLEQIIRELLALRKEGRLSEEIGKYLGEQTARTAGM